MKVTPSIKHFAHSEIVFKSPKPGDGIALLEYFQRLFHESSECFNYEADHFENQSADTRETFIKNINEDPRSFSIFAYKHKRVIGHIIINNFGFERAAHRAYLMIGILKDYQNKGIGSTLMQMAINEALQIGVVSLELRVRQFNPAAISLYEKFGFVRIGCIEGAAKIKNAFVSEYLYVRNDKSLLACLI